MTSKMTQVTLSINEKIEKCIIFLTQHWLILGVPVSWEILRKNAQFFYAEAHYYNNFKVSSGWLDKLKNGIWLLSIILEKL